VKPEQSKACDSLPARTFSIMEESGGLVRAVGGSLLQAVAWPWPGLGAKFFNNHVFIVPPIGFLHEKT
jgi:hypothetical protein